MNTPTLVGIGSPRALTSDETGTSSPLPVIRTVTRNAQRTVDSSTDHGLLSGTGGVHNSRLVGNRGVDQHPKVLANPQPDKRSIAVLPFEDLSTDPDQEYFADDLITDLSKIPSLFVAARNSSFNFRGNQVDYLKIAADLGVRYLLEGSMRRQAKSI